MIPMIGSMQEPTNLGKMGPRFYSPSIDSPIYSHRPSFGGMIAPATSPTDMFLGVGRNSDNNSIHMRGHYYSTFEEELHFKMKRQDLYSDATRMLNQHLAKRQPTSIELETDLERFGTSIESPFKKEIMEFLEPLIKQIKTKTRRRSITETGDIFEQISTLLISYCDENRSKVEKLKQVMRIDALQFPFLQTDLPGTFLMKLNELEEDDPLRDICESHPLIGTSAMQFRTFLNRYNISKDVICHLIWSDHDGGITCIPSIGLVPYPLCAHCRSSFAMRPCEQCMVTKYCSGACSSIHAEEHESDCIEQYYALASARLLSIK
eukprot:TRINITY_DN5547_c0_g2_i1.p1 TRINITY_DN5547_c0_g2~~TRINITY_DN5547_c0_g2_i1.p1  ORF type:complete len:321 (+),score=28.72 TRINITY_DN5547_c0_g2_i1:485-1447(+)